MFKIASQVVQAGGAMLEFKVSAIDAALCVLIITAPNGNTRTMTFETGGRFLSEVDAVPPEPVEPDITDAALREKHTDAELIEQGRDPSAFDAMTYQPPIPADAAARAHAVPVGAPAPAALVVNEALAAAPAPAKAPPRTVTAPVTEPVAPTTDRSARSGNKPVTPIAAPDLADAEGRN